MTEMSLADRILGMSIRGAQLSGKVAQGYDDEAAAACLGRLLAEGEALKRELLARARIPADEAIEG